MKKAVRQAVARRFEEELTRRLPGFRRRRDVKVPAGDLVFSWSPRPPFTFFVVLEVNRDWSSFAVALAWNAVDEDFVRYAAMLPSDDPVDGKLRFPLHRLWSAAPDPWYWEVEPAPRLDDPATWAAPARPETELVALAQDLAADAAGKVEEVGIPYFEGVLKRVPAGAGTRR